MSLSTTARNAWTTIKNETVRRANTATRVGNAGLAIIDYVESLETTLTDDLALKMQYKGDYDVIPYAHYLRNDVYTWRGNLYIVDTEFTTTLASPPEDFHNPDDPNYWTPLTKNINKTITTINQLNDTIYVQADNMVLLLDNRLGGLTSILPSTHSELSICRMEIGKTLGAGGMQFLQKVVDIWGVEWQRYTTWSGSAYVWGYWINVLNHVHALNDLSDVDTTQSKIVPIDADKLFIWDSVTNTWKSVLKSDLNEVYVGDSTPTHNEVLVIDTTSINNLSFIANTSSFIVPDFASVIAKYTSNYASGNAVSVEFPINPPTTNEPVQYLVIKNLKGSDVTFVVNTGDDVVGSITYTYELMQTDSIVVPSGKRVELSYMYMMTSATTCLVSIMYKVQE